MKVVALVPARIGSTRFPRKMLAEIKGVPLICRTYESVKNTDLFEDVIVVTDSDEIKNVVEAVGGKVVMSDKKHETGTDRIAEVANGIDADVFINVQGDEPFIDKDPLKKLVDLFKEDNGSELQAASLVKPTEDHIIVNNPNRVKVLLRPDMFAIYFSRSVVPFTRNRLIEHGYYIHVGIYAFRKAALLQFASWEPQQLEKVEQLECNRFIEYGMPIKMAVTHHETIAVDMPEDIIKAEAHLEKM